jgi:hypothetical protein
VRDGRAGSVCFNGSAPLHGVRHGYRWPRPERDADERGELNANIVADLHESGIAAPPTIMVDGRLAIRAAIVNHRTERTDVDRLVDAELQIGRQRTVQTT